MSMNPATVTARARWVTTSKTSNVMPLISRTMPRRTPYRRRHHEGQVEPLVESGDLSEPVGEWKRQQEARNELHPCLGDAELLEQIRPVAVPPFLDVSSRPRRHR